MERQLDPAAVFIRQAVNLWTILVLSSVIFGEATGFLFTHCSTNRIGELILAAGYVFFSRLLCKGISSGLWKDPKSVVLLRAFAIPIGAVAPLSIGGFLLLRRAYLGDVETQMCGVSLSVGYSYLAAAIWGVVTYRRRREAFKEATVA